MVSILTVIISFLQYFLYWITAHIYTFQAAKMFTSANYTQRLLLCPMVPNKSYMNGMKVGHLSSDCHVVKTQTGHQKIPEWLSI